jgi:hypothetical protein
VELLARGTNTNQGVKPKEGEQRGCTFEQFNKQRPPIFEGQPDAIAAENWISQMEKLMEVMCCTDDQMVRYATFKLAAEAERWWIAKKEHLQQQLGEGVPITWKELQGRIFGTILSLNQSDKLKHKSSPIWYKDP